MKFFGLPNQHIIDYKKCKEVFCFNDKGEFETDDPTLIEWIKKNKPFIRREESKPKAEKNADQKPARKSTTKKTAKGDKIKRTKRNK